MITSRRPTSDPDLAARLGVLLYDTSIEVDAIFGAAVSRIRQRGITVSGILQHFGERLSNGKRSMWVEDIVTGRLIRLDQPRGPGATACMLDPDALAQAACMLRQATASGADMVVASRFGNAEADGRGMRVEIADAICSGAAVLVAARFSLLNDLEGFLGGPAQLLLPSPIAIATWAERLVTHREPVPMET